jgi:hypothetical protein
VERGGSAQFSTFEPQSRRAKVMRPAETLMAGGQNSRHRWAEPLTEGWPCSRPGLYPHSQAGRDPCPMAPTLPSEMNGQLGSRTTPRTSRCVRALAGVRGHFGRESILKGSPSARRHNGNFAFALVAPPPANIHDAPNHAPRRDLLQVCEAGPDWVDASSQCGGWRQVLWRRAETSKAGSSRPR